MSNSDSQVEVKIVGSLDGSVSASATAAKAQIASLSQASNGLGRSLQQEASAWSAQREATSTAATGLEEVTRAAGASHGSVSTATREFRALFDELSSGRTRQTPGTLAIIGQRVLGLGPAALAAVGGVAALAAGFAYLEMRAKDAELAARNAIAGSALANNLVSDSGIKAATDRLEEIPHTSAKIAQETVTVLAGMKGMNDQILLDMSDNLEVFAQATQKDLPKAAEALRTFLEAPAQNGPKFIDMLGASAAQVQKFMAAAKEGNGAALSAGLDIFSQRMAAVDTKAGDLRKKIDDTRQSTYLLMETGDEFGTNVASSMAIANDAATNLGTTTKRTLSADLVAAMRSASEAAATLPPSLDQIRLKMEEIGAESGRTRIQVVQDQTAYLNAALSTAQKASASAEAQHEIETLLAQKKVELASMTETASTKAATQEKAAALEAIEEEVAATEQGSVERLDALQRLYDKAVQLDGKQSSQALSAARRVAEERVAVGNAWLSQIAAVEAEATKITDANAKQQEADVKASYQERAITGQQMVTLLAGIEQSRYEQVNRELESELALYAGQPDEIKKINAQIEANERQHQANMGNIVRQGAPAIAKDYEQAWAPVERGFDTMVDGILSGNETLTQALARGAVTMAEDWIRQELRQVEQTLVGEQAKVAAVEAGEAEQNVAKQTAKVAGSAADMASGSAQIGNDAMKAASGAYSAVVGIPYVGPILAPIAAATAMTAVMAFDTLSSFDVGTNQVPRNMVAMVHQGERIIPRADNEQLMGILAASAGARGQAGGAGGGDVNLHYNPVIHGTQPVDVMQELRSNSRDLVLLIKRLARDGALNMAS